jgi:pimeloyl-ACP methyl ester carboxylesterase
VPIIERPGSGGGIAYQRVGPAGPAPAVLMLQGVGCASEAWRPQLRGLGDRFTLIAVDNRGIGDSPLAGGKVTIEGMAEDALAVMDAENLPRFHVAGHSMGGLIAQEIALRAPERVASLALLCTFARGKQGARMTPDILVTGLRTRIGTRAMRRNAFLELVVPPSMLATRDRAQLAEELRPLFGRDLADQHPITMKQLSAMARYDASARLGTLAALRTLVISADHDRIALPRFGRELATAIPGARYVELADAGHGVPIQRADQVNALLAEHFAVAG